MSRSYAVIVRRTEVPHVGPLTLEQLARGAQLHPDFLRRLMSLGLIDPLVQEPRLLFRNEVLKRIHKIMRLRADLGLNLAALGVVLDLLDRIDELEREVERLRTGPRTQ